MTNDGDLLLRAVLEQPDEDAPRLAYADWLKENGEPRGHERGEYIRYALNYDWHARENDGDPYGADSRDEYPDEADVWPHREWPDSVASLLRVKGHSSWCLFRWRRGFIDQIEIWVEDHLRHAAALFRHHPIVEVTVRGRAPKQSWHHPGYWRWYIGSPRSDTWRVSGNVHYLPPDLRPFLRPLHWRSDGQLIYATEADARTDASRACVRYGRHAAGLSPLRWS